MGMREGERGVAGRELFRNSEGKINHKKGV